MTTIVGIQGDDYAVIGCDSRITSTDDSGAIYQICTLSSRDSKIAKNGKYYIGAAGDLRAINLLTHVFTPPIPASNISDANLDKFMVKQFVPALRSCFESSGYSTSNKESPNLAENATTIMVSIKGNIYIIEGDYSCMNDKIGFSAIGTGSEYALGAMSVLLSNKKITVNDAKEIALKALEVSTGFDPYTGPPYSIFVQKK